MRSLLLTLMLVACAAALPPSTQETALPPLLPGTYEYALRHGDRDRSYRVHVPPQARDGRPLAVVVNFHGGGGYAAYHEEHSGMDRVSDREGFLAVYPDGTGRRRHRLLTFNAGTCCGYARDHQVDDVGFVRALLDDLARRTPLDLHRVYATGLSNGAMMAYRMAAEASDLVAAIAPVAGGMVLDSFAPVRAVAIMDFHSVDDPRSLYHGGLGPPFPFTNSRVMQPDMDSVLARWISLDGCPPRPVVATTVRGAAGGPDSGQTATRLVYGPCREGTEIVHWKLTGVGHAWPGGAQGRLEGAFVGRPTHMLDASAEMWRFFSRFTR